MSYLIPSDYLRAIQDANLQQIISANPAIQAGAELSAQAEALSYLRQKYDVYAEFAPVQPWNHNDVYTAYNRVYLDAQAYTATHTYNMYDLALQNGQVYSANQDGVTGPFDAAKWNVKGAQYDVFYALPPFQPFILSAIYAVGDRVFWKNKSYTCRVQTQTLSHELSLQYYQTNNVPYTNAFPDDAQFGLQQWGTGEPYIIDAGTDILNQSIWADTDNRDQQMVMYLVDITLYHLHSRIAPRNIPQLRMDRYDAAIEWLKMCAKGDVSPGLPVLQPRQGSRVRYGSQIRNINSY